MHSRIDLGIEVSFSDVLCVSRRFLLSLQLEPFHTKPSRCKLQLHNSTPQPQEGHHSIGRGSKRQTKLAFGYVHLITFSFIFDPFCGFWLLNPTSPQALRGYACYAVTIPTPSQHLRALGIFQRPLLVFPRRLQQQHRDPGLLQPVWRRSGGGVGGDVPVPLIRCCGLEEDLGSNALHCSHAHADHNVVALESCNASFQSGVQLSAVLT